jgi:hypothetical protein
MDNRLRIPSELSGHLFAWSYAAQRQVERIGEGDNGIDRMVDAYLFAFAIRQIIRGAEAMLKATCLHDIPEEEGRDPRLAKALDGFLASTPSAAKVRDVLTHFDDYERGEGRLQESGELEHPLMILAEVGNRHGYTLRVGSLRVEVAATAQAARELTDEALNAERRFASRLKATVVET